MKKRMVLLVAGFFSLMVSVIPVFGAYVDGYEINIYGYDEMEEKYKETPHTGVMVESIERTTKGYIVKFQPVTIAGNQAYISEIKTQDGKYSANADIDTHELTFEYVPDEIEIVTDQMPEDRFATLIEYQIQTSNGSQVNGSGALELIDIPR